MSVTLVVLYVFWLSIHSDNNLLSKLNNLENYSKFMINEFLIPENSLF